MTYTYRMNLWLKERFPVVNFVSGALIFLLAKAIVETDGSFAQKLEASNLLYFLSLLTAILIPVTHLFLLRVFDEHKDFESDNINYPQRVLQRGIFNLKEIRKLGRLAAGIQIFCFGFLFVKSSFNIKFLSVYLVMWIWTGLMSKEFFLKNWIKNKYVVYSLSHLIVTPLIFLVCICSVDASFKWNDTIYVSLALTFLTGWLYEVTRKTKSPDEEKVQEISYSKLFGIKGSVIVIAGSLMVTHILIWNLFVQLKIQSLVYLVVGIPLLGLSIASLILFSRRPSPKKRKDNEGLIGLATLFAYFTPIVFWVIR